MRLTEAQWGDVAVDSYIRDRNGGTWRIVAAEEPRGGGYVGPFRAKNREGAFTTISEKLETEVVQILEPTEADHIPMLRDMLGAAPLYQRDHGDETVYCEDWDRMRQVGVELREFRDHLTLAHGMYAADIKTYKQLVEAHAAAHDEDQPHFGKRIPHTHRRLS